MKALAKHPHAVSQSLILEKPEINKKHFFQNVAAGQNLILNLFCVKGKQNILR